MNRPTRTLAAVAAAALFAGAAAYIPSSLLAQDMGNDMGNAMDKAADAMPAEKNIVQVAQSTGMHKTFCKAVTAAGLVDTLSGPGPFTVFAPTDEAFSKLPDGTLEMLLKPENKDKLVELLKHHVVSGDVMAAQVKGMDQVEPLAGGELPVKAENGVIHVIDAVLVPSDL